ncbi:hypothetical protein ACFOOM_32690 [Streptomyces echinoruber]|uniref:Uncharacterized protein n=1 Tax=Streptomyces echinoruber TaxID=68898 RepID=A0A918S0L6_9ACTN|nr:hypothetical protein [Streptomyces echinoruber]GHA18770.1 hypothetical protein GCM10010389_65820 [Streptomyces echinoruber]
MKSTVQPGTTALRPVGAAPDVLVRSSADHALVVRRRLPSTSSSPSEERAERREHGVAPLTVRPRFAPLGDGGVQLDVGVSVCGTYLGRRS